MTSDRKRRKLPRLESDGVAGTLPDLAFGGCIKAENDAFTFRKVINETTLSEKPRSNLLTD